MKIFNKKSIQKRERVGSKLKKLREDAGLSIEEMENITKLEKDYIRAIEASAFHTLPQGELYKKLFVKRYLKPFEVNEEKYLQKVEEYKRKEKNWINKPSFLSKKNIPLIARAVSVIFLVGALLGYIGVQVDKILEPPPLSVESPPKSLTTQQQTINIKGETNKEVIISINGKRVSHNKKGVFRKELELKEGLNTIVIKAKKEHGKATTKVRQVVKKKNPRFSLQQKDKDI